MSKRHSLGRAMVFAREDPECTAACRYVHSIFDDYIDAAVSNPDQYAKDKSECMLQELVKTSQNRRFLRDQLLNVFLGAKDTATIGISDIFFHIARHPPVWKALRKEVLRIQGPLTFEALKSSTYLQHVIRESRWRANSMLQHGAYNSIGLRLLSPVDQSNRICIEDCVLPSGGGPRGEEPIYVQKGSRIEARIGALHRDPEFWGEDAERFTPERWQSIMPKWEYIPFLGGGRMCPAQQMTLTQYAYILARFAQKFKTVENRDPIYEFVEQIKFGKQSKNGVQVALHAA